MVKNIKHLQCKYFSMLKYNYSQYKYSSVYKDAQKHKYYSMLKNIKTFSIPKYIEPPQYKYSSMLKNMKHSLVLKNIKNIKFLQYSCSSMSIFFNDQKHKTSSI